MVTLVVAQVMLKLGMDSVLEWPQQIKEMLMTLL